MSTDVKLHDFVAPEAARHTVLLPVSFELANVLYMLSRAAPNRHAHRPLQWELDSENGTLRHGMGGRQTQHGVHD